MLEDLKYITGVSALNIPWRGTQCDWHQVEMIKNNSFEINGINYQGAMKIFGDYGIYDNTKFFLKYGYKVEDVLVANPIRALLDILYFDIVINNKNPYSFTLDSYSFEDIDHNEISEKINILSENISEDQNVLLKDWRVQNDI